MDLTEYDEFGNYIGGKEFADTNSAAEESESDGLSDASSSASSEFATTSESEDEAADTPAAPSLALAAVDKGISQIIQSDATMYGEDVQMVVATEDNQPLAKPILFDASATVTRAFAAENSSVQAMRTKGLRLEAADGGFLKHIAASLPERTRTIAVVGHSQHGKTSLCDVILQQGAASPFREGTLTSKHRLLDARRLERDKAMSMAAHPFSCVAQSFVSPTAASDTHRHFSFLLNGIDTPGHTNFEDEALIGLTAADAALLVVDVAEGARAGTFRALDILIELRKPFVLFLNKIDRLILELHLPPADAYMKLLHIVDAVNEYIAEKCVHRETPPVDPTSGSVVFGSTKQQWFFSLASIAALYARNAPKVSNSSNDLQSLDGKLWGSWCYDASDGSVHSKRPAGTRLPYTFVAFALEPLYKVCNAVLSNEPEALNGLLHCVPPLTAAELRQPMPVLLALCVQRFLRPQSAAARDSTVGTVTTALFQHAPAPPQRSENQAEALVATVTKFVQFPVQQRLTGETLTKNPAFEADLFYPLVRVISGELTIGTQVRFASADGSERISVEKISESKQFTIDGFCLVDPLEGLIHTESVTAGALVVLRGFTATELGAVFPFTNEGLMLGCDLPESSIVKLRHLTLNFLPLQRLRRNHCVVKVGLEPVNSEIDYGNFLYALRCAAYAHSALHCTREETGERMLLTLGELRLETILFEMREVFGRSARENGHGATFSASTDPEVGVLRLRVSDPFVPFAETIASESIDETRRAVQFFGETQKSAKDRIGIIAAPMAASLDRALSAGAFIVPMSENNSQKVSKMLGGHGWDAFSRKNLWAFGPHSSYGPNAMINETDVGDSDEDSAENEESEEYSDDSDIEAEKAPAVPVEDHRENFVEGFRWATAEGPICGEPVRGVTFSLMRAQFPSVNPSDLEKVRALQRAIVPATRQCVLDCIRDCEPSLLEPMYALDIEATHAGRAVVYALVSKRRGKVMREERRPGSVFYSMVAEVPVLDAFGLEVDLRVEGAGEVYAESRFCGWDVLPGGPATAIVQEIEAHPSYAMASADVDMDPVAARKLTADVVLKLRRRKGMFVDG